MNPRPSFHPRHWGGWLIVGLIECCARLPVAWSAPLSHWLGLFMYWAMPRRRRIAACNLSECFPELSSIERHALLRRHFHALGMMVFESAWSWAGVSHERLPDVIFQGMEHLQAYRDGKATDPLLLVTGHLTCLDIGGRFIAEQVAVAAVYRPLRNPVLEWYQVRGRTRYAKKMLSKYDSRHIMQHLQSGGAVWYAPDQDFGPQRSLFVPFFGHATATLKATWILARRCQAKVVPMFPRRLADGRYLIDILPPLAVTQDPESFLAALNQAIETAVRAAPEQYWWVHRRFKTRPDNEPDIYAKI